MKSSNIHKTARVVLTGNAAAKFNKFVAEQQAFEYINLHNHVVRRQTLKARILLEMPKWPPFEFLHWLN